VPKADRLFRDERDGWGVDVSNRFRNFWTDAWAQRDRGQGGLMRSTATPRERNYFKLLQGSVDRWRFPALDALFSTDVSSLMDSEMYFVFEDVIRAVVAAFSRDPLVSQQCTVEVHGPVWARDARGVRLGTRGRPRSPCFSLRLPDFGSDRFCFFPSVGRKF
jgi:hypothetical protein